MCIALDDHESEGWLVAMLAVLSLIKNKVGWYGALFKSEVPSGEILQCGGKISASVYCSMCIICFRNAISLVHAKWHYLVKGRCWLLTEIHAHTQRHNRYSQSGAESPLQRKRREGGKKLGDYRLEGRCGQY